MSNLFLNNIHQEQTLWPTMANGYDSLPYGRELCRPPFGLRWWETENKCYMYNKLPKYWIGFTLYLIPQLFIPHTSPIQFYIFVSATEISEQNFAKLCR